MIGIFDSGVGGLSVMRAIRDELPSSDIVYFGDTAHAPYGPKSREELSMLTVQAIKLLQSLGADRIVSACNSVSASLAVSLYDAFSLQPTELIEMVGPTVAYFRTIETRLALCATEATIRSGMYQNAFRMIGKEIESFAIPELAGAIENGASDMETRASIQGALTRSSRDYDVLILACTHYPLVQHLFSELIPGVVLFDPALAVAERAKKLFWPQEVGSTHTRFLLSKDSATFRKHAADLFSGTAYTVAITN